MGGIPIRRKVIIGLSLIIVALLILSSVFVYFGFFDMEKKETKEVEEKEIDNRISPYSNQGLMIEVLRIRHWGLLEKMLSFGTSWKHPPRFYYNITVDGEESSVKGNVGSVGVYNEWDTFGRECLVTYDIEEEQEKSDVTITVIEEVKTGLFKRKTDDVVKEEISVQYDFYTGRWTGDDGFKDNDGMSHYLGDTYEVWFNLYQSDYDHDGIPYWIEANMLETDPTIDDSALDPDEDGVSTSWEWKWGYDPFVWNDHKHLDPDVDGIENSEEYQMAERLANPYQPDMYIETDGMEKQGFFDTQHVFYKESQQMLIERFAQHGINVYIDDGWSDSPPNGGGEMLSFVENVDDTAGKQTLQFYNHNFPDERKGIFRYAVVGSLDGGFINPVTYNNLDTIYVGNNLKARFLTRLAFTPRVDRIMIAKNILHEIGHSLGLVPVTFPGNDIVQRSYSDRYPNMSDEEYEKYLHEYYSIMNYRYIYNKPFLFSDENHTYLFDYSDGSNGPPYDQNDWEHVFIPTFQTDMLSYEEPAPYVDKSFEDFEVVNDYPGVVLDGWHYDANLTGGYQDKCEDFAMVKNIGVNITVYVKNDTTNDSENNIRVYALPRVHPTHAVWTLVKEGRLTAEHNIQFYSLQ